jgi:chromosome partitioning protein
MNDVVYPRRRLLDVLEISEQELALAEQSGVLAGYGGVRETYPMQVLSQYRRALGRWPTPHPLRRQLFLNFKGGTGKTSLSVGYAHRLAELGHRVLILDLDSQGHATKCLGFDGEACEGTLFDVLIRGVPIKQVLVETPLAELHLVPCNLRMSTVDIALMPLAARELRLRRALEEVAGGYEYIIMDAPPAFGLLNLNAIVASDDLFVPVLADFLSFHGLKLLFEILDDIEQDLEHCLDRIFIVLNQFNPTTIIAREARDALTEHYGDQLLPGVVRQCTKFAQASSEGVPIFAFDATSKGAMDIQAMIEATRHAASDAAASGGEREAEAGGAAAALARTAS